MPRVPHGPIASGSSAISVIAPPATPPSTAWIAAMSTRTPAVAITAP